MAFKEAALRRKYFFAAGEQLADLDGGTVGQTDKDMLILRFQILHIADNDPTKSHIGLCQEDFFRLFTGFQETVQYVKKPIFENRLDQIVECVHIVGFHSKFPGRSKKDQRNCLILCPKFSGGIDTIQKRHDHIQKDQIHALLLVGHDQIIPIGEAAERKRYFP